MESCQQLVTNLTVALWRLQVFSQRGVRVSFGHPIADFGHPNIQIFVYNAMGWKGIGHPIHPKCVILDTQF